MSENADRKLKCPSKLPCKFKKFSLENGMECTLSDLPDHISAICSRPWDINVLHIPEAVES